MALTLGGNTSSYTTSLYMKRTKSLIDKTLERISSGSRLTSAADDPGGLAVSMRLQNEMSLTNAVKSTVDNSKSWVEIQDGALATAGDILTEMNRLQGLYVDGTSSDDKIYAGQFRELQVQLGGIKSEMLNGVSLFSSDSSTSKTIYTSAQGASGASITLDNLDYAQSLSLSTNAANRSFIATTAGTVGTIASGSALSISSTQNADHEISSTDIDNAIQEIASLRAQSGGKASSLGFVSDYLDVKSVGLASANSRIVDADIAEESMNLTKYNIQYQAAAAALVQSNLSMEVVLELLLFPSTR
ncbi:flagellin [Opitutales bacterium]|nr:flagellin [Opitutales bacterium]